MSAFAPWDFAAVAAGRANRLEHLLLVEVETPIVGAALEAVVAAETAALAAVPFLLEAITAIHRLAAIRLERDLTGIAARGARRLELRALVETLAHGTPVPRALVSEGISAPIESTTMPVKRHIFPFFASLFEDTAV